MELAGIRDQRPSAVGSLEPPYERLDIVENGAVLAKERGERIGQHSNMVPRRAREPASVGEDQSRVMLSRGRDAPVKRCEVIHILSDHRSAFGRRRPKQILVRQPDEIATLLDRDGIVSPVPQQGRDAGGVHLIEEELHPVSSLRSFSQAANSRSAISSFSAIMASISSVNSA